MRHNFTFRLYQDDVNNYALSMIDGIVISDITLVSKPSKFGEVCFHKSNQRKYGYTMEISRPFNKVSGSNSTPTLTFRGKYIDIIVKNFPRYPAFYQDYTAVKNCLNGWGYTNYLNDGFPHQLLYRKFEFL